MDVRRLIRLMAIKIESVWAYSDNSWHKTPMQSWPNIRCEWVFRNRRLLTELVSVDFSVLLSQISIFFSGVNIRNVDINPRKRNRNLAKIIQKLVENKSVNSL